MTPSAETRTVHKLQEAVTVLADSFQDVRDILLEIQELAEFISGEALVYAATLGSCSEESLAEIHDLASRAGKQASHLLSQVPAS